MMNCKNCGDFFDVPLELDMGFDTHVGYVRQTADACPRCRSTNITTAERCSCGGWERYKQSEEPLCWECKRKLKKRVIEFFETLTADELEQVEQWASQISITEFGALEELE